MAEPIDHDDAEPVGNLSTEPWWWRAARAVPTAQHALPESTDVAVIVSGYAGLSCALELARAGASLHVLEAEALGAGASPGSAGFLTLSRWAACGVPCSRCPPAFTDSRARDREREFESAHHD